MRTFVVDILNEILYILCYRNSAVGLEHVETPADMKMWPQFHNGVATGLRIAQGISQVFDQSFIKTTVFVHSTASVICVVNISQQLTLNEHTFLQSPQQTSYVKGHIGQLFFSLFIYKRRIKVVHGSCALVA